MCFENMSLINIRQQCPAPGRFIERSSKLIKNLPNVPKLETFAYITNITANTWSIHKIVAYFPTSIILDDKHEKIVRNNQIFFLFYFSKFQSTLDRNFWMLTKNKTDYFFIFSIQDY